MQSRILSRTAGFTLIELMVVVVIATILLSIAIPSYMSQIRQSRRTDAKTALLDLAAREESYFATNGATYSATTTDLGYSGAWPVTVTPDGYYQIQVCVPAAAACDGNPNLPGSPSYAFIATPVAGTSQASDAQCTSFTIDSTGAQYATGSLGNQCWQQ
jgi:type IV pilus assembly protein PilE